MAKRMILMLVITGVIFGGIFGYKWFGSMMMNQYFDTMPAPVVTISATQVEASVWPRRIEAVGSFKAVNGVNLTTEVGGIVRAIEFENGAMVEQGDVLVRLDTSTDEAELDALRAAYRLAVSERDRLRRLRAQRSVSESELDQAESRALQTAAEVKAQEAIIEQKILRAPFDGTLGIRRVDLGEFISPGTVMVPLRSARPIYLDFSLPEGWIADVNKGAPVTATVDAYDNEKFTGRITSIEGAIAEDTRNFLVQATLENENYRLRPGMFAHVTVEYGEPVDVVVVPQTAVSFNPYGNSVYVIQGEGDGRNENSELTVERRLIRTGERRGDLVAITEGLEPGERVATSGLLKLQNGSRVTINNEIQPSMDLDPEPVDG